MSASNSSIDGKRLDSWKEIAVFFGRDERTVSRWEKELGLPVHRLPGTKGRVYAYAEELSQWLEASRSAGVGRQGEDATQRLESEPLQESAVAPSLAAPRSVSNSRWKTGRMAVGAAMIVAILAFALLYRPGVQRKSAPSPENKNSAAALQVPARDVVLASPPAHDPEAEQLYLKGRYYWNKRTPDDLNKALDYFMQAVVHDPNYAQAYVGLADCYNLMREYTLMPSSEAYPRALSAAKKAVELDDQSSEAHASLAFDSFFGMWDVAAGEHEFRRAIDLNPNNATAHHWYANALLALHRMPEALVEIDRAQALDPTSTSILSDKGNILVYAGRQDEALPLLKQMEIREPSFRSPLIALEGAYIKSRDFPDYLSELKKDALLVHDDTALAIANAAEKGFADGGAHGMFEARLAVQKKLYARHALAPTELAKTFGLLGNKDEALKYLKVAYDQRDSELLFVQIYSELDFLHGEPEYRDLLARLNFPVQN